MTITPSGLADYSLWDATAGGSHTIDPVTAGRRVAVKVWYWSDSGDDPLVAGDLTQTAGTATIGTPILARQAGGDVGGGIHLRAAVFWVPVTGPGSLTLTLAANSASYGGIAAEEFATDGTWDDTPEDDNGQFSATDSLTTYNTGSATSAGAAVFLAALCWNTGSAAGLALSNAPPWVSTGIESDASSHEPGAAAYRIVSSGTTDAGTWTGSMTADTFAGAAAAVAVFKEAAPSVTLDQSGARFGADDGSESAHTWLASQGADLTRALGSAFLYRALLQWDGDGSAITPVLRAQKNGSGGYVAVPVGSGTTTPPTVEAGDCTESGNNTATTSWAVSYPAYDSGDLLIFHVASDANVTHNWPSTGPNGEEIVDLVDSTGGTAQRASGFYFVGSATTSSGTLTVTPSATEQWTAVVLKVPAGEFNSTTPIQATVGTANDTSTDTAWETPAWTADATAGGRVVCFGSHDTVTTMSTASGWTTLIARDRGSVGCTLAARDAENTASESIASASFSKTSETDSSFGYIINGAVSTNELYIATSANITAGGESTTSRLSGGTGTFLTGRRWDDENGSDALSDPSADQNTEVEWSINTQAPATDGDYWDFRVYDGSSALDSYTDEIRLTIGTPTTPSLPMPQSLLQRLPALLRF